MLSVQHVYSWALVLLALLAHGSTVSTSTPLQFDIELSPKLKPRSSARLSRRDNPLTTNVEVTSQLTNILVNATLGTPPKSLQFQVDSASSDIVVIAASAPACAGNSTTSSCSLGTFNEASSSTFVDLNTTFNVTYADGSGASGIYARDNLVMGGTAVNGLQFALAQQTTSNLGDNILGLGYISVESASGSYANLPLRLYVDGSTNIVGYSIWFDGPNATSGKLAFGAIDTGKFSGALEILPIERDGQSSSYDYATINVTSVSATVDGTVSNFNDSSWSAIVDAGTTAIYLPESVLSQAVKLFGAVYDASYGYPVLNKSSISTNASLDVNLGSTTVQIPMADLLIPIEDERFALLLSSIEGQNVLGVPFVRNAYLVFDYSHNQVAVAPVFRSSGSNVTLIGPNGVAGFVSTAGSSAGQSGTSGNLSSGTGDDSSHRSSGFTTGDKIGLGLGVGLGVPVILAVVGAIFFVKRRNRDRQQKPEMNGVPSETVDRYAKHELPGVGSSAKVREKAELSAQNQRHELEGRKADPAELPADMPEPQELAAEHSVPSGTTIASRS